MTGRTWRWDDIDKMAGWLATHPTESEIVHLLARLPFLPMTAMGLFVGLGSGAHLYRCLDRLVAEGMVKSIRPVLRSRGNPRQFYLADLGLAALATLRQVDPAEIARRNRLRRRDLLGHLPRLPLLLACYELLAFLATSGAEAPRLRTWEYPWRRRFHWATAKAPMRIALPAGVTLAQANETRSYLLLPDLGGCPVRACRATVDRLTILRDREPDRVPTLLLVAPDRPRVDAWADLLEEVRAARREAPLDARLLTWSELRVEIAKRRSGRTSLWRSNERDCVGPTATMTTACLTVRPLVGDLQAGSPGSDGTAAVLGRIALALTPNDRALLDLLARHPFLSTEDLATALGWDASAVLELRSRLAAVEILRVLTREESDPAESAELIELTRAGLALVAHWQGLSLGIAVRWNGLAGGGPDRPIGARQKLVQNLAHTRGVDAIFLELIRTARQRAAMGWDDVLLEWRNAAACCRGHLRPDGYGLYRQGGNLYGFFLEYDRGTMSLRGYLKKLATYYGYWESGRFAREYVGFPTILVVTSSYAAERRFAAAARQAMLGRRSALPLLLTTEQRLHEVSNPAGLLGPIWRAPITAGEEPRCWLRSPATPVKRELRRPSGLTSASPHSTPQPGAVGSSTTQAI